MATTKTETVTVRVNHKTSRPHVVWVEPVGWEPKIDHLGDGVTWAEGAAWGEESEEAGIAACIGDFKADAPEEGDVCEVKLSDLFWLSSGDCRNVGSVERMEAR